MKGGEGVGGEWEGWGLFEKLTSNLITWTNQLPDIGYNRTDFKYSTQIYYFKAGENEKS